MWEIERRGLISSQLNLWSACLCAMKGKRVWYKAEEQAQFGRQKIHSPRQLPSSLNSQSLLAILQNV
jgi:hypothetical protein